MSRAGTTRDTESPRPRGGSRSFRLRPRSITRPRARRVGPGARHREASRSPGAVGRLPTTTRSRYALRPGRPTLPGRPSSSRSPGAPSASWPSAKSSFASRRPAMTQRSRASRRRGRWRTGSRQAWSRQRLSGPWSPEGVQQGARPDSAISTLLRPRTRRAGSDLLCSVGARRRLKRSTKRPRAAETAGGMAQEVKLPCD